MSNESGNLNKLKLIKNVSSSKPSSGTKSTYSGIASAQRAIQKPGSSYSARSNQSKRMNERGITFAQESPEPKIDYHSWKVEYNPIYTREKIKKSMTKDPYILKKYFVEHAIESITTEEEGSPKLIPANVIHIEKPIIHEAKKPLIQDNDIPSESPTSKIQPSISKLQIETKTSIPIININKISGIGPDLATTDRLLNRVKIRYDASVIRRPPRRLIRNTTHETIRPLTMYT